MTRLVSKYPVTQRCGQGLRPCFLQGLLPNLRASLGRGGAGSRGLSRLQTADQALFQSLCTCHRCRGPALTALSKELPSGGGAPGPSHLGPNEPLCHPPWCAAPPAETQAHEHQTCG